MTNGTSVTPRLRDVVAALEKRGRHEEAEYYGMLFPFIIGLMYDFSDEEIMNMPIDDLEKLHSIPQKPWKYEGWDTFHFGRAAFNGSG